MNNPVLEILPYGKENRITSTEISRRTGLSGAEIRHQINSLRSDGNPICSDSKGYYIATEESDIETTISNLNSRIHKIIQAREGLKNAKKKLGVAV